VRRVLERRFSSGVDISGDPWRSGQAIMEFGQRICTARPRCGVCPVADGCRGPSSDAATPRGRARFEGSLRQRRGRLLRRVIAEGSVAIDDTELEAAAGLAADGLVALEGSVARAPE
jgi:adenine-specific DNA glycosylase